MSAGQEGFGRGAFPVGASVTRAALDRDPHPLLRELREHEPVSWIPVLGGWLVTRRDLALRVLRDAGTFTVDDPRFSTARVVGLQQAVRGRCRAQAAPGPVLGGAAGGRTPAASWKPSPGPRRRGGVGHGPGRPGRAPPVPGRAAGSRRSVAEASGHSDETDPGLDRSRTTSSASAGSDMAGQPGREAPPGARTAGAGGPGADRAAAAFGMLRAAPGKPRRPRVVAGRRWPARARAMAGLCRPRRLRVMAGLCRPREPVAGTAGQRLAAAADGGLATSEVVSNAAVLMFGGIETTEGMICNAMLHLLSQPDQARQVMAEPAQVENAIEESLRLEPAAAVVDRYATADVTIGAAAIRRGDLVTVSLAGANRDPAFFADPDTFDVHRANARQNLAFARGPHFCIGAHLARLETRTAVLELLNQLPDLRLDPAGPT